MVLRGLLLLRYCQEFARRDFVCRDVACFAGMLPAESFPQELSRRDVPAVIFAVTLHAVTLPAKLLLKGFSRMEGLNPAAPKLILR